MIFKLAVSTLIAGTGGRQATLRFVTYALLARFGLCRAWKRVDWRVVDRLVFICSGNICRSPFAAELARKHGLRVASFGVDASGDAVADPIALAVGMTRGVDMGGHVSTSLARFRIEPGDLFIAMEPRHLRAVRNLSKSVEVQLTLLGMWCSSPRPYLPDPYGKSIECFQFVFRMIEDALENIRLNIPGKL